jgi:ABC-type molybdate transport system substrate-binding protein
MTRALIALAAAALLGACAMTPTKPAEPATPVAVYAAGSLREAMTAIAAGYEQHSGGKVTLTFGASGLLRQRIEQGEGAQVFASADTDHPQRLAARGGWQSPQVFARNSLCALTGSQVDATPQTLLATMLRADVRVGTSTPKADPSGDYAWALFRKAEAVQPGAYARLDAKAQQLTGGPQSPQPPAGRSTYAWLMDEGRADVFLTYCTNAVAAQREVPRLKVVQVPAELQVGAAYGLTVRADAPPAARAFVAYVLSAEGQAVLQRAGFGAP